MFKTSVKFFIAILLSILLINSNSIAFHKENSISILVNTEWDGNKENKKGFENQAKQEFCALSAKAETVKEAGSPVINQKDGKPLIDENGNPVFDEIIVYKINLKSSHLNKAKKVNTILQPNLASMNFNADWQNIKLVEILKMFCLQDSSKDRPIKFKGSYLEEFYTQIAFDNGFLKTNSEEGDYNKKFLEGEFGEEIMKMGMVCSRFFN